MRKQLIVFSVMLILASPQLVQAAHEADDPAALLNQGKIYLQQGKTEQAREAFQEAQRVAQSQGNVEVAQAAQRMLKYGGLVKSPPNSTTIPKDVEAQAARSDSERGASTSPFAGITPPAAPSGYSWRVFPKIMAMLLVPDGWYVKEEEQGDTRAVFITQESLDHTNVFKTGFTINAVKEATGRFRGVKPSVFAQRYLEGIRAEKSGTATDCWMRSKWLFGAWSNVIEK